jgi:hypothetical protein
MKIMILATAALVAATFSAAAQSVTAPGGEDGPGAGGTAITEPSDPIGPGYSGFLRDSSRFGQNFSDVAAGGNTVGTKAEEVVVEALGTCDGNGSDC